MKRSWVGLALALLLAALFLANASAIVARVDFPIRDFFSIWLGGRLFLSGENPYSPQAWEAAHTLYGATWMANPTFLYPYPVAILFAPVSLLPKDAAFVAWVFLLEVMILASVLLVLDDMEPGLPRRYAFPLAVGLILFRPIWALLLNGQFSGFLLLICAGVAYLWHRRHWLAGGAVLAFLMLKPSIGAPVVVLTAIWLLVRRQTRALLGLALSAALLFFVSLPARPSWPGEFLAIVASKMPSTIAEAPTLWGLLAQLTDPSSLASMGWGLLAAGVLLVTWATTLLRHGGEIAPGPAFAVTLCVALLVTPYAWPYDQVLLVLPILYIIETLVLQRRPFLVTATFFLIVDLATILLVLASVQLQKEVLSGLIPLAVFVVLTLLLRQKKAIPTGNDSTGAAVGPAVPPS